MSSTDDVEQYALSSESQREVLIKYLRTEAYAVRDCFTKYSISILATSGAIVVAIARFQSDVVYIGFVGFFPILLLVLVFSMGAHKYGTSNRLLGYELHLQRTAYYLVKDTCHELMEKVGWEEAMRAWRVVTPTLFAKLYWPRGGIGRRFWYLNIDPEVMTDIEKYLNSVESRTAAPQNSDGSPQKSEDMAFESDFVGYWFDQKMAFSSQDGIVYNAGGYLKTNISIFSLALLICVVSPAIELHRIVKDTDAGIPFIATAVWSFELVLFFLALGWINIVSRIRILESGLLSIQSSAIIWEATVLAHLRALQKLGFFKEGSSRATSMHGYTIEIAKQARQISDHAIRIHGWIRTARDEINKIPLSAIRPPVVPESMKRCGVLRVTVMCGQAAHHGRES